MEKPVENQQKFVISQEIMDVLGKIINSNGEIQADAILDAVISLLNENDQIKENFQTFLRTNRSIWLKQKSKDPSRKLEYNAIGYNSYKLIYRYIKEALIQLFEQLQHDDLNAEQVDLSKLEEKFKNFLQQESKKITYRNEREQKANLISTIFFKIVSDWVSKEFMEDKTEGNASLELFFMFGTLLDDDLSRLKLLINKLISEVPRLDDLFVYANDKEFYYTKKEGPDFRKRIKKPLISNKDEENKLCNIWRTTKYDSPTYNQLCQSLEDQAIEPDTIAKMAVNQITKGLINDKKLISSLAVFMDEQISDKKNAVGVIIDLNKTQLRCSLNLLIKHFLHGIIATAAKARTLKIYL